MKSIDKLEVACELLDRSLRLYYEGDSYFSAIHLAGAAEEILGVYVGKAKGQSAFDSYRAGAVKLSRFFSKDGKEAKKKNIGDIMNHAINNTKHGHGMVRFDAKHEAEAILERAVINYYFLMSHHEISETPLVRRFNSEIASA